MATLISNGAAQNLTGAATFAAAEAGALANVLNRNTTTAIAAATTVTSVTFTVTNTKVIDAVMLWVRVTAASPTGTFKVDLQKGGVSQAAVTVNKADLPQFVTNNNSTTPAPVLFKLTTTATGDGGANWTIVITTTGTGTVTTSIASATTTNYTRALRTTTAATAAAADDLYIMGELTGAGTNTARTVNMNSTATTAYGNGALNSTTVAGGGIHISCYGSLVYGTSASTAYVLRVAGDLNIWDNGTFTMGSTGSEIPRTSTAVLEFVQNTLDGDFGFIGNDNSTINVAGLSRTSGKNIVKCHLNADAGVTSLLPAYAVGASGHTSITIYGAPDPANAAYAAWVYVENSSASTHYAVGGTPASQTGNSTQTAYVWLKQGSGTHNRFVRFVVGNSGVPAPTNGFFADIDLQAGTIGTCTAIGNGTATSATIAAKHGGYLCTIVGKCSSAAATPIPIVAACSAAGTTSYTGDGTQNWVLYGLNIVNGASAPSTTFGVDTDTGWLANDVIGMAMTTVPINSSNTENESFTLISDATSTQLVSTMPPQAIAIHSGTAATTPNFAEVVLLTRNVIIRSTSSTLSTYVYFKSMCIVSITWCEFFSVGTSINNTKIGLTVDPTVTGVATAKSVTYCSFHHSRGGCLNIAGFQGNGGNSSNVTFANNNLWVIGYSGASGLAISTNTITLADWTIDNCVCIRSQGGTSMQFNGVFTNNSWCFFSVLGMGSGNPVGTFSNNTIHSNFAAGMTLTGHTGLNDSVLTNTTIYNNAGGGLNLSNNMSDQMLFDGLTCYGNASYNIGPNSAGVYYTTIKNAVLGASNQQATVYNVLFITVAYAGLILDNCDTSAATGRPVVTNDFGGSIYVMPQLLIRNCKFGATNLYGTNLLSTMTRNAYFAHEKYNQVAGDHRFQMRDGLSQTDTVIYNTASPSQRMTPSSVTVNVNNAVTKFESALLGQGKLVAVQSGNTVSISVYIRKSSVGDGAAYTGSQPRLIQRANPALGQLYDVVLATYSAGTGAWTQLTGTSSSATDDGCWEFIVDCDGTAGWINVDDWAAT